MQTVDVGETWPLTSWWFDINRDGVEPSALTLTIHPPLSAQIVKVKADLTPDATRDPKDTWAWPLLVTEGGVWRYTFSGVVDGVTVTQSGEFLAGESLTAIGACEPWCTWDDVTRLCPGVDLSAIATGEREALIDEATDILFGLDGKHYPGICQTTRRMCRTCQTCSAWCCTCGTQNALDLGRVWPVYGVWDVTIDGEVLPTSAYQLRDRRYVDRLDGESWPACGNVRDPDAFTVSYAYGRRPPTGLRIAAAVFAAEMAKSCVGAKCELPQRVTSITREGISYTILDSQKFLDDGRVGIYRVDLALAAAKRGRMAKPGMSAPYGPKTTGSRIG